MKTKQILVVEDERIVAEDIRPIAGALFYLRRNSCLSEQDKCILK